jgi:hypothetical protein
MSDNQVPAISKNTSLEPSSIKALLEGGVSISTAIMLDETLFRRATSISQMMARAQGIVPKHLLGKPDTCFAVICSALTWKMDAFQVANATYDVHGKVGYYGRLCQAIIENSGRVEGGVEYEEIGDWSKVMGKFAMKEGKKQDENGVASKYAAATYTEKDEEGLGIIASIQVKGEAKPRTFKLMLRQCYPRNSTLWATDPLTQIKYRAARGLGNLAMPGIFMGVPLDLADEAPGMVDVTPPPAPEPEKKPRKSKLDTFAEPKAPAVTDVPESGFERPFDQPDTVQAVTQISAPPVQEVIPPAPPATPAPEGTAPRQFSVRRPGAEAPKPDPASLKPLQPEPQHDPDTGEVLEGATVQHDLSNQDGMRKAADMLINELGAAEKADRAGIFKKLDGENVLQALSRAGMRMKAAKVRTML